MSTWSNLHYRYCDELSFKIRQLTTRIVKTALDDEIRATMKQEYGVSDRRVNAFFSDININNQSKTYYVN